MNIQGELNRQDAKNAKIIRRVWGIYRAERRGHREREQRAEVPVAAQAHVAGVVGKADGVRD
jgi:hypothetical protein